MSSNKPLLLAVLLVAGCGKTQEIVPVSGSDVVTFVAENELSAARTELGEVNCVNWVAKDAITIFDGKNNVEARTEDSGAKASFTAQLKGEGPWYAIYPYRYGTVIDKGTITAILPARQVAKAGTFGPMMNLAVAYSGNTSLNFKNVVGFIKISVSQNLIREISIKGNDGEALAGTIRIAYNDGKPSVTVTDPLSEVILAPEEGFFEAGRNYYAAVLPQTLSKGFTLTYTDAFNEQYSVSTSTAPTFKRSVITAIGSPDSKFVIDSPVTFACEAVKTDLLNSSFGKARFGKIEAGKIYKSEMASVTYAELNEYAGVATGTKGSKTVAASSLWSNPSAISSFNELKYFVGLFKTDLVSPEYRLPSFLAQLTNLTSIELPYNLSSIEAGCFQGCTSLASLTLPENYRAVFGYTFAQCTSLESLDLPNVTSFSNYACIGCGVKTVVVSEKCTGIGAFAFQNCVNLTKLNVPASPKDCCIETIGQYAFDGCKNMSFTTRNFKHLTTIGQYAFQNTNIKNLTIPNCTSIGRNAFYNATALVDVYFSKDLKAVEQYTFTGCKSLTGFSYIESNRAMGLELPEGMTSIGAGAFGGCVKLKMINMPSTMTSIGKNVFRSQSAGAVNIDQWIVNASTPPSLGEEPFYINKQASAGSAAQIVVPSESVSAYKTAANWSAMSSVIEASGISSTKADLVVKGVTVDVRTWGCTADKVCYVFPLSATSNLVFSQVSGNLPIDISSCSYAVSQPTIQGIQSVKATAATRLTIATPATLASSTGWTKTSNTMVMGGVTFKFYSKQYSAAQAEAGEWVNIPNDGSYSTFIFNNSGNITVDTPAPPVTIIDRVDQLKKITINHPCIIKMPDGSLLASQGHSMDSATKVYKSTDGGETWNELSRIPGIFHYGEMVNLNGVLYYSGCTGSGGDIILSKSTDDGESWCRPITLFKRPIEEDDYGYHTGPNPWVEHNGRIYRAFSDIYPNDGTHTWGVFVISAAIDADLCNPTVWTMSNIVYYDRSAIPSKPNVYRGEEPNIFVDKDGNLKILLRMDETYDAEYAQLYNVIDYKTVEYSKTFIMPGSSKKFNVFWDQTSGKYWSVVSPSYKSVLQSAPNRRVVQVRNSLATISSTDLEHWTIERVCIYSDDQFTNGYHYMDWRFDGDDIVSVFRCAFDEERGMAYSAHDANGFGFFRIRNFRNPGAVAPILVDTPVTPGVPVIPEYGY